MSVKAILGAQWGDEGKGKIVDVLSENAKVIARFQGGANAGHTIQIGDEETILHQLPSGIMRKNADCILGNGMVVDPVGLKCEIELLENRGMKVLDRIYISRLAHVVTPIHKYQDAANEAALGKNAIGTTKRGIGPCYADKVSRTGIQARDLLTPEVLEAKIANSLEKAAKQYNMTSEERSQIMKNFEEFHTAVDLIKDCIGDTLNQLHDDIKAEKEIMIEGAQGALLDIDFGTYPFVTSSNTISGNICSGLGIGPKKIDNIIGIFKAYCTRVGAGPFPTEQENETGKYLRKTGGEFGATTGRPRRCGWFDAGAGKYSAQINGYTEIALTKLDVLDDMDEIKICVGYKNGKLPGISLTEAEPDYITFPGWKQSITGCRTYDELPEGAKKYVSLLEELLETPIKYVSVGKARDQIIIR